MSFTITLELNTEAGFVTCETGMIFATLEDLVNEKGYSVMHLPSCMTCCTVGGALAHNGIGILSTKYGKMDDMCLSLEVVLPNGDIINTLPVPKHSSGPNLIPFFVGSEGTLGIMTKAKFKIVKQPETRIHHAFLFSDIHVGYQACRDIVQAVKPSIVRLFDEAETVSIIKKIIGFEKRGSFLNLTLEGYEKVARKIWARNTAKSGSRTALPSSILTISWICPRCSVPWTPWRPTTILRRSTGQ